MSERDAKCHQRTHALQQKIVETLDVIAPIAVQFAGQSRPTSSASCTGLLGYSSTKLAAANKAAFTKAMKATVR